MATWKERLRQFVGACSMVVGALGLLLDSLAIFVHVSGFTASQSKTIRFPHVFLVVCGVAMIWFACCFISGIYLWGGDRRGYWMALFLALFQIAYTVLFVPITLSFYGQRGIQVAEQAMLIFKKVDNGLSLLYSLCLLLLVGGLLRKTDFNRENALRVTTLGDKLGSRNEPIYLVRGLGVANMFFGVLGILLTLVDTITTNAHRGLLAQRGMSWNRFALGATVDSSLLISLLFAGYLLFRLDRRGVVISNVVLTVELVYWLVSTLVSSLSAFSNFGLLPQVVTAYPLLALPLLNWGAIRIRQAMDGNLSSR